MEFRECRSLKKLIIYPPIELSDMLYGCYNEEGESETDDSSYDISDPSNPNHISVAIFAECPLEYLVIPKCIYDNKRFLIRLFGVVDLRRYIKNIRMNQKN
jgi:hypothetical protein